MGKDTDVMEWKPEYKPDIWERLSKKLTKMLNSIPSATPGEFALITRKPADAASTGKIVHAATFEEAIKGVLDHEDTAFTARWFVTYNTKLAILLVKVDGKERGTHYLIGPNQYPEDMRNHLNFMRSMEKASDNLGY